jgi:hypothetical protein
MNHSIKPGPVPPRPGLEREEPEIAQEDDIPSGDKPVAAPTAPVPPATEAPKPANPEPVHEPKDPEKHHVKDPEQGKSEHPAI